MPEGDTVFLAATRLRAALEGRILTRTDFRVPALATVDLSRRELTELVTRGKHLLFRIEGGVTLHTHFKMDGAWHVYPHGDRWRAPAWQARAVLETAERVAVGFELAITELVPTEQEQRVVGHLGPDPLAPDWDRDEALRRLCADPARAIAEALLDQRVMAGPGNVYKSEICFLRGIDPPTPVGALRDPGAVVDLTRRLMQANRTTGRQITTGNRKRGAEHWVYGRAGLPCRRCGSPIASDARTRDSSERVSYWCPSCQARSGARIATNGGAGTRSAPDE